MKPHIVVIGEAFTDRYFVGEATRLSPEAPVPVVRVVDEYTMAGGAANVAANVEELGGSFMKLYPWGRHPEKNRLLVGNIQLARWDRFDSVVPITREEIRTITNELRFADGVIFSDYAKGALDAENLSELRSAIPSDTPVFIDTKQSPNLYSAFADQAFFFPNLKEYDKHRYEYRNIRAHVIRKEGSDGLTWFSRDSEGFVVGARVPGNQVAVQSVTGAGDVVIAAFAVAYLEQGSTDIYSAMVLANAAAAVAVKEPFTTAVTKKAQQDFIDHEYKFSTLRSVLPSPEGLGQRDLAR